MFLFGGRGETDGQINTRSSHRPNISRPRFWIITTVFRGTDAENKICSCFTSRYFRTRSRGIRQSGGRHSNRWSIKITNTRRAALRVLCWQILPILQMLREMASGFPKFSRVDMNRELKEKPRLNHGQSSDPSTFDPGV